MIEAAVRRATIEHLRRLAHGAGQRQFGGSHSLYSNARPASCASA
jgi:hypothetical protein